MFSSQKLIKVGQQLIIVLTLIQHLASELNAYRHEDKLTQTIPRILESSAMYIEQPDYNRSIKSGIIEAAVYVDKSYSDKHNKDVGKIKRHIESVVRVANYFWMKLNFIIYISKIVFINQTLWPLLNESGEFPTEKALFKLQDYLSNYDDDEKHYDSYFLLLPYRTDHGRALGNAMPTSICQQNSSISFMHASNHIYAGLILAHEIGHQFGMAHDSEYVSWQSCFTRNRKWPIMTAYDFSKGTPVNAHFFDWTNCNVNSMRHYLKTARPKCLVNTSKNEAVKCGNGLVEKGEQCECIGKKCSKCCINCRLTKEARCGSGVCCDLNTCKPYSKESRIICRAADDECDIPDVCDGSSSNCPEDVYKHDGEKCGSYGSGYCYKGYCGVHEDHCNYLFGYYTNGAEKCYLNNYLRPSLATNCGPDYVTDPMPKAFIRCDLKDILCGKVICSNDQLHERVNLENPIFWDSLVSYKIENHECWSLIIKGVNYKLGASYDLTYVPNGAKCGDNMMCFNRTCHPLKIFKSPNSCPDDCNGNGWCDNRGKCHCFSGINTSDCYRSFSWWNVFFVITIIINSTTSMLAFTHLPWTIAKYRVIKAGKVNRKSIDTGTTKENAFKSNASASKSLFRGLSKRSSSLIVLKGNLRFSSKTKQTKNQTSSVSPADSTESFASPKSTITEILPPKSKKSAQLSSTKTSSFSPQKSINHPEVLPAQPKSSLLSPKSSKSFKSSFKQSSPTSSKSSPRSGVRSTNSAEHK